VKPCRPDRLARHVNHGMSSGKHRKNEDLNGFIRGAHQDGEDVCAGYIFHVPGQTPGLWGWNDTQALFCKRCGKLATEHVVLKAPKDPMEKEKAKKKREPQVLPSATPQSLTPEQKELIRYHQTEQDAVSKAAADKDMLDETIDPLAIAAQAPERKKKPEPPPPPPVEEVFAPPPMAYQYREPEPPAAARAVDAPTGADSSEDPEVSALLAREKASSAAFKDEVDRMIREAVAAERRQALDRELDARLPPKPAPAASKPVIGSTTELLEQVGLTQYLAAFDEEAMDLETLRDVFTHQGRPALEEVLQELGVASKGHRMKIANAIA